MSFSQKIINWIAGKLKIPDSAMQMFKSSNEISGINKKTLPSELIPLNSIQISRGLLNFTVLQSNMDWVFPYWINRQYDPEDISFIPRSHLGLSMNITHRNWTAVGNPDCKTEPIVDPRGMVTPFKNGWSLDVWLIVDGEVFLPSKSKESNQILIDDLPVVETTFSFNNVNLSLTTYTVGDALYHNAGVINNRDKNCDVKIVFSVRPFNPEGISLLKNIEYDEKHNCFIIEKSSYIYFNTKPDIVHCSSFNDGDAADYFLSGKKQTAKIQSACSAGMASAGASFSIKLNSSEEKLIEAFMSLEGKETSEKKEISGVKKYWNEILSKGTKVETPDDKLNSILKSSLTSLLMFVDEKIITPGPFTYHQFWFRDAAFMLFALDNFGFHDQAKKIIRAFPEYQDSDGYFRSQKGEWDSNGQAIWTIFQHYKITNDIDLLNFLYDPLLRAVKWIDNKRIKDREFYGKAFYGLLPSGMSAEHLGLADHYFWDNFWSSAGIKNFIEISKLLDKQKDCNYAEKLFEEYNQTVNNSIEQVQKRFSVNAIPASPLRNLDCGVIGNVCAGYPLRLFKPDDPKMISTLEFLEEKYFVQGFFFQHFIHSGMNPYLTLQIAHSYLYSLNRSKFVEILYNVLKYASSTNNYPEAINPLTKGGAMGDGHHGWASAEISLALHDAFLFEKHEEKEVVLLKGIPAEWFDQDKKFFIKDAPVSNGIMNIEILPKSNKIQIKIDFSSFEDYDGNWKIFFPFKLLSVQENNVIKQYISKDNETVLELIPGSCLLTLEREINIEQKKNLRYINLR